jgi:hypothetical protein
MIGDIQAKQNELEQKYFRETVEIDKEASLLYKNDAAAAASYLTDYSVLAGNSTVKEWKDLYKFLFTKYMDGNVKERKAVPSGYKYVTPKISQPGYSEDWNRFVAKTTGDRYRMK